MVLDDIKDTEKREGNSCKLFLHEWRELESLGATFICIRCGEIRAVQDWLALGNILYNLGDE